MSRIKVLLPETYLPRSWTVLNILLNKQYEAIKYGLFLTNHKKDVDLEQLKAKNCIKDRSVVNILLKKQSQSEAKKYGYF